jgi:peptidoglycan/LPS O-acetylase OafA/YrhL
VRPTRARESINGFDGLRAVAALTVVIAPHLLPAASPGSLDGAALTWVVVVAVTVGCGAASWYLVERPVQRFFGSRGRGRPVRRSPGRMAEIGAPVQSTLDPLNSAGVAVDHLA